MRRPDQPLYACAIRHTAVLATSVPSRAGFASLSVLCFQRAVRDTNAFRLLLRADCFHRSHFPASASYLGPSCRGSLRCSLLTRCYRSAPMTRARLSLQHYRYLTSPDRHANEHPRVRRNYRDQYFTFVVALLLISKGQHHFGNCRRVSSHFVSPKLCQRTRATRTGPWRMYIGLEGAGMSKHLLTCPIYLTAYCTYWHAGTDARPVYLLR